MFYFILFYRPYETVREAQHVDQWKLICDGILSLQNSIHLKTLYFIFFLSGGVWVDHTIFFFFFPKFTQKHAYSVLAQKSLSLFISSNSPHPCRMIRNLVTGPLACSINGAVLFFSQHSKFFWWLLTAKVTDHIA